MLEETYKRDIHFWRETSLRKPIQSKWENNLLSTRRAIFFLLSNIQLIRDNRADDFKRCYCTQLAYENQAITSLTFNFFPWLSRMSLQLISLYQRNPGRWLIYTWKKKIQGFLSSILHAFRVDRMPSNSRTWNEKKKYVRKHTACTYPRLTTIKIKLAEDL